MSIQFNLVFNLSQFNLIQSNPIYLIKTLNFNPSEVKRRGEERREEERRGEERREEERRGEGRREKKGKEEIRRGEEKRGLDRTQHSTA